MIWRTAPIAFAVLLQLVCTQEPPPPGPEPTSRPEIVAPLWTPAAVVPQSTPERTDEGDVTAFVNVAAEALLDGFEVSNYRPSAVVFDYDRDGNQDLFITQNAGHSNFLYQNRGDSTFADVSGLAGVSLTENNSSGAMACDLDNDGYQDLYVGARGVIGDDLDYRSAEGGDMSARVLRAKISDHLFRNNGDGTFTAVTASAFGDDVNIRSASSIACADVDGDGFLDIYVGNAVDEDWFIFDEASHAGHYNRLYMNNGDLTFEEVSQSVGVAGEQIMLRDVAGESILFTDPETEETYEGWDPTILDAAGNVVADPSGRTHGVMFFDHDDDGDPDLWVANDGHRPYVYRNDSAPGDVRFTPVAEAMGIDQSGNWMGFAVADYDGDSDLDVFIANVGPHLRRFAPQEEPGGDCRYSERFSWGTCLHYLLRKDGTREAADIGVVGIFPDVAAKTDVTPSPLMPPRQLERRRVHPEWEVPTGLSAYDFGYGTTFFDFDNDGDQDLYFLGSEGPPGNSSYPAAGRMLRGDGQGSFEDITVRARLLDILDVDYSVLDADDPKFNPDRQRIGTRFHLNGKALAHGDFNGDGYLDLVGTNSSGAVWDAIANSFTPALGPVFLWMNGGGNNHWISLRLKGRTTVDGSGSNADGIGARVYLRSGNRIQVQEVRAGSSYLAMDSIELEFGLANADVVEEIRVRWPSGRVQVIEDVGVDQVLEITEPRS